MEVLINKDAFEWHVNITRSIKLQQRKYYIITSAVPHKSCRFCGVKEEFMHVPKTQFLYTFRMPHNFEKNHHLKNHRVLFYSIQSKSLTECQCFSKTGSRTTRKCYNHWSHHQSWPYNFKNIQGYVASVPFNRLRGGRWGRGPDVRLGLSTGLHLVGENGRGYTESCVGNWQTRTSTQMGFQWNRLKASKKAAKAL